MSDFVYDKTLKEKDSCGSIITVAVTVVDVDPDSNVQINVQSGMIRIPFFLSFRSARLLAKYLESACDAYDIAATERFP